MHVAEAVVLLHVCNDYELGFYKFLKSELLKTIFLI